MCPRFVAYCLLTLLRGDFGMLGNGCNAANQFANGLIPLIFGDHFIPKTMGMGTYHSCVISTNGSMICFGLNRYGQLGYGDTESRGNGCAKSPESLAAVDLGTGFIPSDLSLHYEHTWYYSIRMMYIFVSKILMVSLFICILSALSTSGELKCWGL